MDEEFMLKLIPILRMLESYHRHEAHGLDSVPKQGPVIIASTHSLATYDILLLMNSVFTANGRFPRSLIDRLFYKIPGLGDLMEKAGAVVGNPENAKTLLHNGEMLYLAPGGMQESLRPSRDRYQVQWNNRKGFARLAIETGAPVVLACCPRADDIFKVYQSSLTNWAYDKFKIPLFVARGMWVTPLPRPVKLEHYLSKPYYPPTPKEDPLEFKKQVYNFHQKLLRKIKNMIAEGIVKSA